MPLSTELSQLEPAGLSRCGGKCPDEAILDLDIEGNCWCGIPHLPHPINVELQVQLAELNLLLRKQQQQQQKLASYAMLGLAFVLCL